MDLLRKICDKLIEFAPKIGDPLVLTCENDQPSSGKYFWGTDWEALFVKF